MLEALAALLRSGAELVFCLMLVFLYLSLTDERELYRRFKAGCIAGLVASLAIYDLNRWVVRMEMLDVIAKGLFVAALAGFFLWLLPAKRGAKAWGKAAFFLLGFALLYDKTSGVTAAYMPIVAMKTGFNSEWVMDNAAAAGGALLLLLMALAMKRMEVRLNRGLVLRFLLPAFAVLLFGQVIEWLQLLFGLRILPLNMLVLDVLAPFINHKQLLFYGQLAVIGAFPLQLAMSALRPPQVADSAALNPAQKRKRMASERRVRRWFQALASLVAVMVAAVVGDELMAAQEAAEKPAVPVRAEYGRIVLPKAALKEKELNLFSYQLDDHTQVRFMAVRKAGDNFGAALDACPICGVAGYYEKDGHILCKKCDSAVSVATIGFKGGCNPIPIQFEAKADGTIVVPLSELESAKTIFQ